MLFSFLKCVKTWTHIKLFVNRLIYNLMIIIEINKNMNFLACPYNLVIINHSEKNILLGITYVQQYVYMYVWVCVLSIVVTPFNLKLGNFGITFFM